MEGEEMPADSPAPEMERWRRRGAAAGRLVAPKDVHMLSPFHGKWDFTDVIKDAEKGGDTWIIGLCGPDMISRVLERCKREAAE